MKNMQDTRALQMAGKTTVVIRQADICSTNHLGDCQMRPNGGQESLMILGSAVGTPQHKHTCTLLTSVQSVIPCLGPHTLTAVNDFDT